MSTATATKENTNGAIVNAEPKTDGKITARVLDQISSLASRGRISLPSDYSVENALASAWLKLQEIQNLDKKPVFKDGQLTGIVTLNSVVNALHDYCIQGLNCAKNQAYFIVYADRLVCQRSYFGDMALAQRVQPEIEIVAQVVYEDDEVEYEIVRGRTVVTKHKSSIDNRDPAKIKAAYCSVYDKASGEALGAEIMTIAEIHKSWRMSKAYGKSGTHENFPEAMAMRTVVRKRCKPIINSSNDALLLESVRRQGEDSAIAEMVAEMDGEIIEHANSELLEAPSALEAKVETVVEPQAEPEPEKVEASAPEPGY